MCIFLFYIFLLFEMRFVIVTFFYFNLTARGLEIKGKIMNKMIKKKIVLFSAVFQC